MKQLPGIFFTASLGLIFASASANAQTGERKLNLAEKWVATQVTAGKEADLGEEFPNESDRKLSAHFLEDLLMGALPGVKPQRKGVWIVGATIDDPIELTNAKIPFDVSLVRCEFMERVTFRHASFAGSIRLRDSAFRANADFNSMMIGDRIVLDNAVFEGPADFGYLKTNGTFEAQGTKFLNKEEVVNFDSIKVGESAFFRNAVFQGGVKFILADIALNLEAQGAKFLNNEQDANFNTIKVGNSAFFNDAVFEGGANFNYANIAIGFVASKAHFQNKERSAGFISIKVGQYAFFDDVVFEGPVRFTDANFASIDLLVASWPKAAAQVQLRGMTYKYIRAALGEAESHKALLQLINQSSYTSDTYGNLESFFLRQGYRGDADRAFIEGKRRERSENLRGLSWLGSWLLDQLVGYGRRPWQAGIPCVFFVALGCFLFSPQKMELQKPDDAPRVYNRFWYSLGLFLPFVDLQADKVWKPKSNQTFLRNYMRVHALLGWILIPIVLAALTGLIK